MEAIIDFGDDDREDDVNDKHIYTTSLLPKLNKLKDELCKHINDNKRGEIVREGVKIALVGPPNAGTRSF